jgi:hypothetical protein
VADLVEQVKTAMLLEELVVLVVDKVALETQPMLALAEVQVRLQVFLQELAETQAQAVRQQQ